MTGCLIHRISQYRWYKDARVRLVRTFPVVPFRNEMCHIQIGFMQLGMLNFCRWLQLKR